MATVLAGPVIATFLGDFGADVVKVEEPRAGDMLRRGNLGDSPGGEWLQEGRNKRCIAVDLRTEGGQRVIRRMLPAFDVVIQNFTPGTAERWGLSGDDLLHVNPRLIVALVSGYGQTGPKRTLPGFDRTAVAFGGLAYSTGERGGEPSRPGYAIGDYMAAYLGLFGVMTALYERDANGGAGQTIDISLFESVFRATEGGLIERSLGGPLREREGSRVWSVVPAGNFRCQDGRWVAIQAATDANWVKLCEALGFGEAGRDPRFATRDGRIAGQDEIYALLNGWAGAHTAATLVARLQEADVPAEFVMNMDDILADAHYEARGAILRGLLPGTPGAAMPGVFPKLTATPGSVRFPGRAFAADTIAVLSEFGFGAAEIEALIAVGAVRQR